MFFINYLVILIILIDIKQSISVKSLSECEKNCHSSFTAIQKSKLCQGTDFGSIGPASCAVYAKNNLHLKIDDILSLCTLAKSSLPAECVYNLKKDNSFTNDKERVEYCSNTNSIMPATCYIHLVKLAKDSGGNSKLATILPMIQEFCQNLDDPSPLYCIQTATAPVTNDVTRTGVVIHYPPLLTVPAAIEACQEATGTLGAIAQCISDVRRNITITSQSKTKPLSNAGLNSLSPSELVKFCSIAEYKYISDNIENDDNDLSVPISDCFLASFSLRSSVSNSNSLALKPVLRTQICEKIFKNSPLGPIECIDYAMTISKGESMKLSLDELLELCSSAVNSGPVRCYDETRGLGKIETRIDLCKGATSAGPANCYRRASSVFKGDDENKLLLCVGTISEDSAVCASQAPHYLTISEKVHLCELVPISRSHEPIKCLQASESQSRVFKNAPTKALGYFTTNLINPSDHISRELLINMCSFGGSDAPLATAMCFKSAPVSLAHDDAVRICTNISSEDVISHIQLCTKILPKEWQSNEIAIICDSTTSRAQTEAAVKCAVDVYSKLQGRLNVNRLDTSLLCKNEKENGIVLECASYVLEKVANNNINWDLLKSVCSSAVHSSAGKCLAKVFSYPSAQLVFDSNVPIQMCKMVNPIGLFGCIENLRKRLITIEDIKSCKDVKRMPTSVVINKIISHDNAPFVTSGKRFSLRCTLMDQWGGEMNSKNNDKSGKFDDYIVSVSINENNDQGAVLWGTRSNATVDGELQLNSLIISQPGELSLKITFRPQCLRGNCNNDIPSKLLSISKLFVKGDESYVNQSHCLPFFSLSTCPIHIGDDYNLSMKFAENSILSDYPRIRGYLNKELFYQTLSCLDTLMGWYVTVQVNNDGSSILEYKSGIDSIWTGIGLPRMEMSYEERLGLDTIDSISGSKDSSSEKGYNKKQLRRAYYKMSLQWHPDRWSAMPMYALPVHGVFELITEAYSALNVD